MLALKDVDFIQDPATGRFQGSRPQGGDDSGGDKPAPAPPAPKVDGVRVHGIHGMPKDAVIPSRELATAVDRGAFTMTATERPKGKFESGRRFEISIAAKRTAGVKEYMARATDKHPNLYDPRLATLVTEDKGEPWERQRAIAKEPSKKDIEPLDRTDVIYRGMSAEEFEGAQKNGYFESRGEYNIGGEQEGKTYWANEVKTAQSYANGFAPWQYGATFEKPAYVVAVPQPENAVINPRYENEVAVPGRVPTSEIVAYWKGDVFEHLPGTRDAIQETETEYRLGGGSGPRSSVVWTKTEPGAKEHPGKGYSKGAYVKGGVIYTTEVDDAARALHEGKKVELDQPRKVSTLIDKLGQMAQDAIAKGEKAPLYNLCNVSVTGTNLFCADNVGIPRVQMPQLDDQAVKDFTAHLKEQGYKVTEGSTPASHLRATQNELNGAKVADLAVGIRKAGGLGVKRIVVSRDDYILDGHHHWAAKVGLDAEDGSLTNDTKINIYRVDISITKLLEEAEQFSGPKEAFGQGRRHYAGEVLAALIIARKVDYIQDPETGRLMGSHPGGDGDGGGDGWPWPKNADPANPTKTKDGERRTFYRGIWGPDKHDPEHHGPESWTGDPEIARRYAEHPNDPIRLEEFTAAGGTVKPTVLTARLHSDKPFVITEKKIPLSEMAERLRLDKDEAAELAADIDIEEAFERKDPKFEAWQYGDSKVFNGMLTDRGYDLIASPGSFIDPKTDEKRFIEEMRVLDADIVDRTGEEGSAPDKPLARHEAEFVSSWAEDGIWTDYQHAARAVISGLNADEYVCYDCSGDDQTRYNKVSDILDSINSSPDLGFPLYRGITGGKYNVGDRFSESIASWTKNKDLAEKFAGGVYAGDYPSKEPGQVLTLDIAKSVNSKGLNVSAHLSPDASDTLRQAGEYLTSGEYEVTAIKGHEITVRRVGPAVAKNVKRAFDPSQPRDEHGRWTDGGGSDESAPRPFEGDSETLLLVSERPSDEKLILWQKQIDDRIAEIQKETGTADIGKEETELNRMSYGLKQYLAATEADRESDRFGLQTVYDGDGKLLATAATKYDPETSVAKIISEGGTNRAAKVKALEQVIRRYGEKADRIESYVWSDDPDQIALYEEVGFKKGAMPAEGMLGQKMVYGEEGQTKGEKAKEQQQTKEHSQKILGASQAAAQLLGYDPSLVDVSNADYEFTIGGEDKSRKAAGLAHLESGKITIFPREIRNAQGAVSVMAHEVAHQKYDAVLKALTVETTAIFADPGPPPNPSPEAPHWEKIGGKDAVTAPDGSPRPPYDKKYPLYARFHKHNENLDKRIKSDGITQYSKDYWEQAKPGAKNQVPLYLAQHETIAEMARILTDTGKLEGAPEWRSYYKDIDRTYEVLRAAKAWPTSDPTAKKRQQETLWQLWLRETRKVDYIQDPETGRLMGSHPSGGDEAGAAPAAEAADKPKEGGGKKKSEFGDFRKAGIELDNQTTISREKRDKFIERWNTHVGQAPEEFHNQFVGGLKSTMRLEYRDYSEEVKIDGDLLDKDGEVIGVYTRIIDLDDKTADSNYFKLYNKNKGGGIGKQMLAANVEMYRALGVNQVTVHANIDVGGYAWARYGYVPTEASWAKLSMSIRSKLTDIRDEARGGRSGGTTPGAWDEMSHDQQEEIESLWMGMTHESFLEGEIENWRDSGDALDQAKVETANNYDGPPWPEWVIASMEAWREQYKDDHDGKEAPFTDNEILAAISVDYESGHEGRHDPDISFDDSVLDAAASIGADPKQPTLPGIEPVKAHQRLTQEMREDIQTEMTSRFNRKAKDDAADIEPPEYLSDSVRDTQSDFWGQMENWERYRWARDHDALPDIPVETAKEEPVEVDESTSDALLKLARSKNPKALWAIADSARGKDLLLNSDWSGVLDLKDKETMDRFNAYVAKGKK